MAEELQALFVRLDADIERLRRAMKDADKSVAGGVAGMEKSLQKTRPMFDGLNKQASLLSRRLAGLFTAGMAIRFARSALDTAGSLGELSEQIGVNTDLLQTLQYASGQAGVKFEQTTQAIAKLTDKIGEAANGNSEAIESFRRIGVSFADANGHGRDTESTLIDISNALSKMPSAASRAATATDFLGKAGQKLLPILSGGEAGLKGFAAEAEKLGLILPKEKIEAADKAMDSLAQSMLRLKVGTAATVAGPLSDLVDVFDKINRSFEENSGLTNFVIGLGRNAGESMRKLLGGSVPDNRAGGSVTIPMPPAPAVNPNSSGQFNIVPDIERFAPGVREEALFDFNKSLRDKVDEVSSIFSQMRSDAQRALGGIGAQIHTNYTLEIDELEKKLTDLGASQEEIWEATSLLIQARAGEMKQSLENISNAVDENDIAWDNWLHSVSDGFADAILKANSLGDVLKQLLVQLAKAELSNLFYSALGGGGKTGSILKGAGKLLGFADGGVPPVGVPSIVGERGPELVVPKSPVRIVPNHKLGSMGGNTVINQSINVQTGLPAQIVAQIQNIASKAGAMAAQQTMSAMRGRA